MKTFHETLCMVTGAGSGIGRAVALALAGEGARLCLTDINRDGLLETIRLVGEAGGQVVAGRAFDVSDEASVMAFADEIHRTQGSVDLVMNVAGISTWGTIEGLESAHWRRLVEVNLMGPIQVLRAFVPGMINAGRGGHIVNVSSAAGLFGLPWHGAYSATKFGLRGVSEVLRFDLDHHNIGVSLVCPGAVDTGLVNTIDIVGVDRDDPDIQAMTRRFQRHAVTPARAAAAILKGVRHGRYMIFTSLDVRIGYWFQRKWVWPYEMAMRLLSAKVFRLARSRGD
ncbi:SDR family oxidoreductase [Alloalcanivorax xenomutans]|uniref:SDR family oxidoreductase n=1 Tax=Alloalcanivorax xenomutans TaxID=1094342 RepID=UPI003BA8AEDA